MMSINETVFKYCEIQVTVTLLYYEVKYGIKLTNYPKIFTLATDLDEPF